MQAVGLVDRTGKRRRRFGVARAAQRLFQLRLHPRDRRPQIVRHRIGKHAQLADQRFDPVEHRVDRYAQPVEGVTGPVALHPRVEPAADNCGGGARKDVDAPPEQPGDERGDDSGDRDADREREQKGGLTGARELNLRLEHFARQQGIAAGKRRGNQPDRFGLGRILPEQADFAPRFMVGHRRRPLAEIADDARAIGRLQQHDEIAVVAPGQPVADRLHQRFGPLLALGFGKIVARDFGGDARVVDDRRLGEAMDDRQAERQRRDLRDHQRQRQADDRRLKEARAHAPVSSRRRAYSPRRGSYGPAASRTRRRSCGAGG